MRLLVILSTLVVPLAAGNAELKYCPIPVAKADAREHKCLATMVYGEARGESTTGMTAVAFTALNRAVNARICQVVLAPNQYSIFNNNPALRTVALSSHAEPEQDNLADAESWQRAVEVAHAVLENQTPDPTKGSTNYLSPSVMKIKKYKYPQWAREFTKVAIIDQHHFYKQLSKN